MEDENFCEQLFYERIMINKVRIEEVIRMGKVQHENQDRRPSPMLVKLANKVEKWNVLKNANVAYEMRSH